DVFTSAEGGNLISAHGVMVDSAGRVRLTMSGEVDPGEGRYRGIVGPMNRLLHWHEMQYYKERGIRHYDFGGLVVDEASPAYEISRFKLSFGGEPAVENVLRLWRGAASRRLLRRLAGPDGTRRVLHPL